MLEFKESIFIYDITNMMGYIKSINNVDNELLKNIIQYIIETILQDDYGMFLDSNMQHDVFKHTLSSINVKLYNSIQYVKDIHYDILEDVYLSVNNNLDKYVSSVYVDIDMNLCTIKTSIKK